MKSTAYEVTKASFEKLPRKVALAAFLWGAAAFVVSFIAVGYALAAWPATVAMIANGFLSLMLALMVGNAIATRHLEKAPDEPKRVSEPSFGTESAVSA